MTIEAAASAHAGTTSATLPRRSLGGLIAISIFWFALNFHWAALQSLIIPNQVIGILFHDAPGTTIQARAAWAESHKALTLAIVVAPGLVVALITNPLFGFFSDRTSGRFGRRRPYIIGGTLANVVGLAAMALLPAAVAGTGIGSVLPPSAFVLMGGLMLVQLANNAAAAPFHALLPDLVPQEQRGTASGIMGLAQLVGQIGGFVAPVLFGFSSAGLENGSQSTGGFDTRISLAYGAVAVVSLLMAVLTIITVKERPWSRAQMPPAQEVEEAHATRDLVFTIIATIAVAAILSALLQSHIAGLSLNSDAVAVVQLIAIIVAAIGTARAFGFRPRRNADFSWVLLTRMLVQMGIYVVYSYLNYYMHDVAKASNPNLATTEFLVILTLTALISSIIGGPASDRFGRKRMVYISGVFMTLVGAAFIGAPLLFPSSVLTIALLAAAIFGLGYGAYISVDWALVADVLPSEATFARDMGVWNIGLTLPQAFATIFGGWVLTLLGTGNVGYTGLFFSFVVFCVLGTITVRNIKGVKR